MKEQLLEIDGVGEATAEEILEVVEENSEETENKWLQRAYEALADGDDKAALVFLERSQ